MKILVTGGAGFIGSRIARQLVMDGDDVTIVDDFNETLYPTFIKRIRERELRDLGVQVVEADIASSDLDIFYPNFELIINEAGLPGQQLSWDSLGKYLHSNVVGISNILNIIKGTETKIVQASTSSVYGVNAVGNEQQNLRPCSPYGVSKLAAEKLIDSYSQNYKIKFNILRYFSVYGPSQRPDMAIQRFLTKILKKQTLTITGDGNQRRDLTFVDDIVSGTLSAAKSNVNFGEYNLSGGIQYTVNEIVDACREVSGLDFDVNYLSRPAGDQESTLGDHDLAKNFFNYTPTTSLAKGIAAQFEWILRHPQVIT